MSRQELIIAVSNRLSCSSEEPSPGAFPAGGLYFRLGLTWSEIHWAVKRDRAAAATLAMWDRPVSHLYSFGAAASGSPHLAANFVYSSAFSLPGTP